MTYVGHIEAAAAAIDREKWLALIDAHDALGHVPPQKGVNPFTRKPTLIHAPKSDAKILRNGVQIGSVGWALDGSPVLHVNANDDAVAQVCRIADDIATSLGARFVRDQ
jgi:hypothetical protein